ncbi:MAG: hypothetical protein PHY23_00285 [Oscillospiraceae bacterium]|nr:hypothetical protein [Oscillospiraceae bacterium]
MSYMENNTAMVETKTFLIPTVEENDLGNDDLAEDMDGLQVYFQKVKIPSGGMLQFELPGDEPENPNYAKTLEGVILFNHASGAYWPEGSEYDDDTAPLCASIDGKTGYGAPGGACALCELNQYGTASKGRGKACKNMRVLYLLRDGEYMPIQISLPPTSIGPFRDFMNMVFVSRRRPIWSSVVQIGLKKMSNGKDDYSVATFKKISDFSGEQLAQAKAYATSFREQAKGMLQQRAETAENRDEAEVGYGMKTDYTTSETDSGFCISGSDVIDGERDDLPM